MTATVTDLPVKKNSSNRKKITLSAGAVIIVVGCGLLIDDQLKKLSSKRSKKTPKS
jgi:hypothetical protein